MRGCTRIHERCAHPTCTQTDCLCVCVKCNCSRCRGGCLSVACINLFYAQHWTTAMAVSLCTILVHPKHTPAHTHMRARARCLWYWHPRHGSPTVCPARCPRATLYCVTHRSHTSGPEHCCTTTTVPIDQPSLLPFAASYGLRC
jgi:hypothetical protein